MKKLKNILLYSLLVFTFTYVFLITKYDVYKVNYNTGYNEIKGTIIEINYSEDKVNFILLAKEKIKVSSKILEKYNIGDYVEVKGILAIPSNNTIPNLFNYRKYLLSNKIYYLMDAESVTKISSTKGLYKVKNFLYENIDELKSKKYVKTFVLGDKNDLDNNIKQIYQENGVSHLLAISGMHVSLLASILKMILKKIKHNHSIISLFLVFYAFLTSFTSSVVRATLFFVLGEKINIKKLIILVACGMLLYNPYYIYNVGFLFSFVISFYLIMFSKKINAYNNYFAQVFMVSFISFLAGLPIVINNFYTINFSSIFINIVFVPFVSFIIFPLSLLTLLIPFLDTILYVLTNFMEFIAVFFNDFNITLNMCAMPFYIVILYYILITLSLYKIKYIWILIILIILHTNIKKIILLDAITSIDVGQGDSILLELQNKNVLIDTGGILNSNYDLASNKIIPYIKSRGINKINYLVLSHGDYDHMGEAINLVENFKVANVIFNCGEFNELEQDLIKVLDKKKIKYYSCIKELNIDKYKLQFLNTKEYDDENDNSNVIYFNYNNYEFLFMGDAGVEKEKDILDKYNLSDIDFLKVGHHGSNTSSSEHFIDIINPKYSLISVGKNNRYGHPKGSVLDILSNSKIYRTDLDGSIEIKLNKNGYKIRSCPP